MSGDVQWRDDETVQDFVAGLRAGLIRVQWCARCARPQGPGRRRCQRCTGPLDWCPAPEAPRAVATVWTRSPVDGARTGVTLVRLSGDAMVLCRLAGNQAAPEPGDIVELSWVDGDNPGVVATCPAG